MNKVQAYLVVDNNNSTYYEIRFLKSLIDEEEYFSMYSDLFTANYYVDVLTNKEIYQTANLQFLPLNSPTLNRIYDKYIKDSYKRTGDLRRSIFMHKYNDYYYLSEIKLTKNSLLPYTSAINNINSLKAMMSQILNQINLNAYFIFTSRDGRSYFRVDKKEIFKLLDIEDEVNFLLKNVKKCDDSI